MTGRDQDPNNRRRHESVETIGLFIGIAMIVIALLAFGAQGS